MPGPHRSSFSYGSGPTVLTLTWAARPYEVLHSSVGGVRWAAAAGNAASYVVRRDRDLAVTLRVLETEREGVETFIEWAQGMASFSFAPDADTPGTSYTCQLVSPEAGEKWQPQRDDEFPHQFFIRIVLRKSDGSQWTDAYFT